MWEMMKRRELIGEGFALGFAEGFAEGFAQGRAEAIADMSEEIRTLAPQYGISPETAEMLIADIIRSIEEEHNIKLMEQQTQWQK